MRRSLIFLMLCAIGWAPGLASDEKSKKDDAPSETSHETGAYTYMETNGETTFLVDGQIAIWHEQDEYFPMQFALGFRKKGGRSSVTVALGDFTLLTPDGKAYKPVSYDDIMNKYKKRQEDQNLILSDPIRTEDLFDTFEAVTAPFYPETNSPRMTSEAFELPSSTFARGLLYFPMPESGLGGVLTVVVESPGIDPPLEVKLKVPEKHEKDKRREKKSGR